MVGQLHLYRLTCVVRVLTSCCPSTPALVLEGGREERSSWAERAGPCRVKLAVFPGKPRAPAPALGLRGVPSLCLLPCQRLADSLGLPVSTTLLGVLLSVSFQQDVLQNDLPEPSEACG